MKKKLALLLSLVMIIASLPVTAFGAGGDKVYAKYSSGDFKITDSSFNLTDPEQIVEGSEVTDLKVYNFETFIGYDSAILVKDRTNLKNVIVDGSNYYIESGAFHDFVNLETVTIEDGVVDIYQFAFENTAIKEITLPSTVDYINRYAFGNMSQLEKIVNNSASKFQICVGGIEYTLLPNSTLDIGLGLSKDTYIVDSSTGSFSVQLDTINDIANDVSFSIDPTINYDIEGISITSDGLLTGPVPTDDFSYKEVAVTMTSPTQGEKIANIVLEFRDFSKLTKISFTSNEGVTVNNEMVYGEVVVDELFKSFSIELNDSYGPIRECYVSKDDGYSPVGIHMYGNELLIDGKEINGEDMTIEVINGYYLEELVDSNELNDTYVNTFPYQAKSTINKTGNKVILPNGANSFYDCYSVDLEPDERINVKLSGTSENIPVDVIVVTIDIDENGNYLEYTGGGYSTSTYDYNYDNYNFVGEDIVLNNHRAAVKGNVRDLIFVNYGNVDSYGKEYEISIEKSNVRDGFPEPTVINETLDFSALPESINNEAGKYSWDKATKTLTLKDGFYLDSPDKINDESIPGIILPENAKVNIEGKAYIVTRGNGIEFNTTISGAKSDINMAKDSKLTILSNNSGIMFKTNELIINGVANENGALPIIDISSQNEGIESIFRNADRDVRLEYNTLNANNVQLDILTSSECIQIRNGIFKAKDSTINLTSYGNEAIYLDANDVNENLDDGNISLDLNNCKVNIISEDEGVESEMGGAKLVNCETDITVYSNDEGIWIDESGDIYVEGGSLSISSNIECLDSDFGKVVVKGSKLNLNVNKDKENGVIEAKAGIDVDGTFAIYDSDGNFVKIAPINDFIIEEPNGNYYTIGVIDENGNAQYYGETYSLDTTVIESQEVTLDNLKQEYAANEDIVVRFEINNSVAEIGDVRYMPESWEIVGTDVKGTIDENCEELEIPKDNLADGEYTLKITYVAKQLDRNGNWREVKDENGKTLTKETTSKFIVQKSDTTEVKSPLTGPDTTLVIASVMMLGLAYSLYTVVRRKKKYSK